MGLLEVLEDRYAEALEALKSLPIRWDRERFAFWLRQDYPFVEALYCYQAGLLLEAPQAHRAPLVQALMATVEELDWLLAQGADPGAQVHPVRREYIGLLEEMGGLAYPYRLVFFYFLNRLFLKAWNAHVGGKAPGRSWPSTGRPPSSRPSSLTWRSWPGGPSRGWTRRWWFTT
jgi:hypothetical protein